MVAFLEDESAAAKLRQQLRAAYSNELKLLCGLGFFDRLTEPAASGLEGYLREFAPAMAAISGLCDPDEFLPEDHRSLQSLLTLVDSYRETVGLEFEQAALANLERLVAESLYARPETGISGKTEAVSKQTTVSCLFVEDFFYLDHESRGRLLTLYITAEARPAGEDPDEIELRNAVDSETDPFIVQARKSIVAAREYLTRQMGLSSRHRFRFEISVNHKGARFTGDSLGVAIAVGAAAAISRVELLRVRLSVPSLVAFTGALSLDGSLESIDPEGLRKKIKRAFYSELKCLVIPIEHLPAAREYLASLNESSSSRANGELELIGVDRLEQIIADPRLVRVEPVPFALQLIRKLSHHARSPWLEVPALLTLLAIAFFVFAPAGMKFWRNHNPNIAIRYSDRISILSADSLHLWDIPLAGPIETALWDTANYRFVDLDGDSSNEFLFIPHFRQSYPWADSLIVFSSSGRLLFKRDCEILNEYVGDTISMFREAVAVWITRVAGRPVIITAQFQHAPARQQIKFWDVTGRQLGWYINAGGCQFQMARDLDNDGREELLFRCFNNRMKCVATFALKPDGSQGVSPPYQDSGMDLTWVKHGNQFGYVIYPMTDVAKVDESKTYDDFGPIEDLKDGTYKTFSIENSEGACMYYLFGPDLRVRNGFCSDQYSRRHAVLTEQGRLKPAHTVDQCVENAVNAVSYWTSSGWVTEGQFRAGGK